MKDNGKTGKAVLRYIHQNPIKAGLCGNAEEYRFSSYNDYERETSEIVDIGFVLSLMDINEFRKYHQGKCDDQYLDAERAGVRIKDIDAMTIIEEITQCKNASEFQALEVELRNMAIKRLREKGLSIRQISRLTGVSKGLVERAARR